MAEATATFEPDAMRQATARRFWRAHWRWLLARYLLAVLYLAAWPVLGWSGALVWQMRWSIPDWSLAAALQVFAAILGGGYYLLDLPLSYQASFVLPHRFGLSVQTRASWFSDQAKFLVLNGVLSVLCLPFVIVTWLTALDSETWLVLAIMMFCFMILFAFAWPVLIFPLFYRTVPLAPEHTELAVRLLRLAKRARLHMKSVRQFDLGCRTRAANAMVMGLGATRRIVLSDTLLQAFTLDEIEAIVAHELGHVAHRDIFTGAAVQAIYYLAGSAVLATMLQVNLGPGELDGVRSMEAIPWLALAGVAYFITTAPLLRAYSRWRERRADAYALRLMQNREAWIAALTRLVNMNLEDASPAPWARFYFGMHPSYAERVAQARQDWLPAAG